MKTRFWLIASLVGFAVLSRFLPHPWNWTAVGAAALFGGARLDKAWQAILIPVVALAVSDLVLGFHSTMAFTWGAFGLIAGVAHLLREKLTGAPRLAIAALASSGFFFLVSNFGVWFMGGFYSPDLSGLLACYIAGLPFLASQAMGDLFYVGVLFGLEALLVRQGWLEPARV